MRHGHAFVVVGVRLTDGLDGRISESGTYRELVSRKDSRFRALMAAQLSTAEAGVAS